MTIHYHAFTFTGPGPAQEAGSHKCMDCCWSVRPVQRGGGFRCPMCGSPRILSYPIRWPGPHWYLLKPQVRAHRSSYGTDSRKNDRARDRIGHAKGGEHGRCVIQRYKKQPAKHATNTKFEPGDILEIRRRHALEDAGITELAGEYGVRRGTIADIVHRRTWRHVRRNGSSEEAA